MNKTLEEKLREAEREILKQRKEIQVLTGRLEHRYFLAPSDDEDIEIDAANVIPNLRACLVLPETRTRCIVYLSTETGNQNQSLAPSDSSLTFWLSHDQIHMMTNQLYEGSQKLLGDE